MYTNNSTTSGLGVFAWITAGLGLILIAALIIFTLSLSERFQQEIAFNQLGIGLAEGDISKARRYSLFLFQHSDSPALEHLDLEATLNLISQRESAPHDSLLQLQQSLNELKAENNEHEEASILVQNEIQKILEKQDILSGNQNQLQTVLSERETILQRFVMLAADLNNVLSISDRTPVSLDYYNEGILAMLPKIEGIKDDIPDTSTLVEQLQEIGGEIRRTPGAPPDDFVQRINLLRSSSLRLIEQDRTLGNKVQELEKEQHRLEIEIKKNFEVLSKNTAEWVLLLAKPESMQE